MKAGLLGRKLGHSYSPQIHRFFGDYEYRLYEKEPDEVEAFLRSGFANEDFDFLNVTIPYKQTVFALCDVLTPIAQKLGNVNFVTRTPGGLLMGDNTDAYGVERLARSLHVNVRGMTCAILGAGGAAMTAKAVLEECGVSRVTLVRRGEEPAQDDELIVNATPVGMWPNADDVRVDIAKYPNCRAVLDLVYNPSPTRLVREARAHGKDATDGLLMLVAQAYRSFLLARFPNRSFTRVPPLPHLFLYGPPASGKSTWARRIASATGWACLDLDKEIAKAAGKSIVDIFSAGGESDFRAIEKKELKRVIESAGPKVIALGGGALLDPESRKLVEAAGRVVVLDCPIEELKTRLAGASRPLSSNAEQLEKLVRARMPHYASFARHVLF